MTAHFEAKLHGFRRTQDGVVISYVVHPNDLSREMALAPLGTRYMVAFSEIGDDEKRIVERPTSEADREAAPVVVTAGETAPNKDRKPFSSLPLSQQAALRCGDDWFWSFIGAGGVEQAAQKVRERCGITTRATLDDPKAASARHAWTALESEYQAWQTDNRYGSARR